MGTILDSTKELSKKLGVEAEEQTIKDQIDAINESIDENFGGSVDIAEAVRTYSENAGGGGDGGFTKISTLQGTGSRQQPNASKLFLLHSINGVYALPDSVGAAICLDPVVSFGDLSIQNYPVTTFTPSENFVTPEGATGDTVTPGDGKTYCITQATDDPSSGIFHPSIAKKTDDFISDIQ